MNEVIGELTFRRAFSSSISTLKRYVRHDHISPIANVAGGFLLQSFH
jgi:hypothetical protein